MWASAVACAWNAIRPFRPGNVAYAGVTPVKMQAKVAPATISGIGGFTVSSCDVQFRRASWDSLECLGFHISVGSRSALSFGISGNSRQKLATEISFFVVDQNGSRIRTVITS